MYHGFLAKVSVNMTKHFMFASSTDVDKSNLMYNSVKMYVTYRHIIICENKYCRMYLKLHRTNPKNNNTTPYFYGPLQRTFHRNFPTSHEASSQRPQLAGTRRMVGVTRCVLWDLDPRINPWKLTCALNRSHFKKRSNLPTIISYHFYRGHLRFLGSMVCMIICQIII